MGLYVAAGSSSNVFLNLLGPGNFFANAAALRSSTPGVLKDVTGSFTVGFSALAALCVVGLACTAGLSRARRRLAAELPARPLEEPH